MAKILFWSKKIEDDRGQRFEVIFSSVEGEGVSLRLLPRAEVARRLRGTPSSRAARIRRRLLEKKIYGHWGSWIVMSGSILVFGLIITLFIYKNIYFLAYWILAVIPLLLGATGFIDFRRLRNDRREIPGLQMSCLVCSYDISNTPLADDGCRVCSECGGAWDFAKLDARLTNKMNNTT